MKVNVAFLVLPEIHLLDLAGVDQVFLEAIDYGAQIQIEYCSYTDNLSTSTSFPIGQLKSYADLDLKAGNWLFIPGSNVSFLLSHEMKKQKDLFDWVKEAYAKGVNICSVCTGSFFLAQTGLLNDRKCTTHWKRTKELQDLFPAIRVQENILFTEDQRLFTSAGVTSGTDMALFIVERLTDEHMSWKVARELVVYIRRDGDATQHSVFMNYRNHIHAGIHSVQDFVQDNLDEKIGLPELADIACMSPRNLTRIFRKETGISVNEYVNIIRKEKLRELLKNPDVSRAQLARHCGLKSERQVGRLLQEIKETKI